MMSKYLLLLFVPAIYANIAIKITTGETEAGASIECYGQSIEIVSDKERETFGIGDQALKKACEKYSEKDQMMFTSGALHLGTTSTRDSFGSRSREPVKSRVLGIHSKPVIVATRVFKNNNTSGAKVKYNAAIAQQIEETVSNTWSVGGELTGMVFANYFDKLKGHNFWAFPVNMVLRAAGLPTSVKSTEKISVGFYTSATIEINDMNMANTANAKPMKVVPAGIIGTGGRHVRY